MKATFVTVTSILLLCASWATFGNAQMYDESYAGPRNYYGHPQFEPYQMQGQQAQQNQSLDNGLIFQAARGVSQIGQFLWGYAPAPMRGAPPVYNLSPNSGQVTTTFVPGR